MGFNEYMSCREKIYRLFDIHKSHVYLFMPEVRLEEQRSTIMIAESSGGFWGLLVPHKIKFFRRQFELLFRHSKPGYEGQSL